MTALEIATHLVNRWISKCTLRYLSPDRRAALLIQMIAGVIDRVGQKAYKQGWRDGAAESDIVWIN